MIFNAHSELRGKHAFLSPSQSAWLRYDPDKLRERYYAQFAQAIGTHLHEFAALHIHHGIKLNKSAKSEALLYLLGKGIPYNAIDIDVLFPNLLNYVNDAIGFRMTEEQVLKYSDNCFGTADAIGYDEKRGILRVSDLKTGITPASMDQLYIYIAMFCLEYRIKPGEIKMETRIYQANEIILDEPTAEDIVPIMDEIVTKNKMVIRLNEQED